MKQEAEWKRIVDFPDYWISDGGRVVNVERQRVMRPSNNGSGEYVTLTRDKQKYTRRVSVLMREYWPTEIPVRSPDVWMYIPGARRYTINLAGDVRDSKDGGKILKPYPSKYGNATVTMKYKDGWRDRGVRNLVLVAFRMTPEERKAFPLIKVARE